MLIKQVVIQGFKSYRDQTACEPFSPGLNIIGTRLCHLLLLQRSRLCAPEHRPCMDFYRLPALVNRT